MQEHIAAKLNSKARNLAGMALAWLLIAAIWRSALHPVY